MNSPWNNIKFDELENEVEQRLDEIFKEIVNAPEVQKKSNNDLILDHLNKLNKILLSIKLEDAGNQIVEVLDQLESLKKIYKEEKYFLMLIRLQRNLCNYIKVHKVVAHPLSLELLRSIFNDMCDIIYAKNIKKVDIKRIINKEIKRYNKFYEFVKNRRHPKKHKSVKRLSKRKAILNGSPESMEQKNAQIHTKEILEMRLIIETLISDIKDFMRKELEKLKTELQAGFFDK